MIKETKSPQVTAAQKAVHLPVRRIHRDAVWGSLDTPQGADVGNLLYRFYDDEGLPLYIGKTTTGTARLEQHRKGAEWYGLVEFVALSLYPNHESLLRAERAAIRKEQPRFNKQDRRGRRRVELNLHESVEAAAALLFDEADTDFLAELTRILSTPSRALLAVAPPEPEWDDAEDLAPAVRAQLAAVDEQLGWATETTDLWHSWLDHSSRRPPTREEADAFFGRMFIETNRGEFDRRQLRILARCMIQLGRYDIDEVFPHFAAMYAQK